MDYHYDLLFNLQEDCDICAEDDDIYYHKIIPTIDVEIYKQVLEEDVNIINQSKLSMAQWVKFKYGLLKCEKDWQTEIFKWKFNSQNADRPYIGIDIDWSKLENKPKKYFLVHMAFEGLWMGDDRLVNVWEKITNVVNGIDGSDSQSD